jgi:LuxR family maltose regulon positive regulatory protein
MSNLSKNWTILKILILGRMLYNCPMSTPILATKLYIPPPRPKIVPRPRLLERLNEGLQHPSSLTLISAPAGFGKTTLVSHWLHPQKDEGGRREEAGASVKDESGEPISDPAFLTHHSSFIIHHSRVAWLSLDPEDNDPSRFLAYLVAALQTITPNIGEGLLAVLQTPQPPPLESTLTTLLNEITTFPEGFILVLDDYHVIEANLVNGLLTFLIEHLPPQARLVITTREDPQLPLARYVSGVN